MNTGEDTTLGGWGRAREEQNSHNPALTELRGRLEDGLCRSRLNKTDLARRAGLQRTTVSAAFSGSPQPSRTVSLPAQQAG
ncbi:hypothetical protein ABZ079_36350 [Streptomyces sp. NPDC006314]|uniref:hypothetical protein n=1 Tax=Streptomyces sp. NPDC006314 TaxID=3154475 RepID=UPI0033B3066B